MHFGLFCHIKGMKKKSSGSRVSPLPWHSAFKQAMQAELYDYREDLDFRHEYQLTTEPLRIDLLIIKKTADLIIEKNIARMFKTHNRVVRKLQFQNNFL